MKIKKVLLGILAVSTLLCFSNSILFADLGIRSGRTEDYDTGAGSDRVALNGVALPSNGGAVAGGTSTNPLRIDPTGSTTQPVSAASLPLPSGASTAAKQDTGNTSLASIDGKITSIDTNNVTVTSAVLPTGAATAANQDTGNTSLASLDTKFGEVQASPTANTVLDRLKAITTALAGTLSVATHAVTQSGTWNITNVSGTVSLPTGAATAAKQPALGTAGSPSSDVISVQGVASGTAVPISAASLPLPSTASTSTKQSDGSQKTQIVDGSGNVIGSTSNALDVNIASGASAGTEYTDGAAAPANPVGGTITFNDGGTMTAVSDLNPLPVSASIDTTGLATSAKQDTIIGHVDGIEALLGTIDADTGNIVTSVQLLDDPVSTLGTDTYTETTSKGFMIGAVRRDADTTLVNTTNEIGPLQMDANGRLKVEAFSGETLPVSVSGSVTVTDGSGAMNVIVDSSALPSGASTLAEQQTQTTALQLIDDPVATDDTTTHSTGSTKVMGIGAVSAPTDTTLNANDIGMPGMTVGRELYSVIRDAAGNLRGANVNGSNQLSVSVDNTVTVGSHAVTNAGTFAVQESGSALTALQLIDDGVYTDDTSTHSTGSSKGYAIMGAATPTDTAVNANDLGIVGMTNNRELYVSIRDIAGATAVTGSGTATGALRVELANNGTGLLTANPGTAANWGIYVEDAGETAGANLQMAGTVRRDTQASSAGTTGDNATLNTDANGNLWITGTYIEDAGETAGAQLLMSGSVRRDTAASSAGTTGDNATINTDALGKLWTTGSYAEDAGHTTADTLVAIATRRIDTPASSAGTSADYATLDSTAEGALWTATTVTTTGGWSTSATQSAASTNSTNVKNAAGNVYMIRAINTNATIYYLRMYNSSGAPTCSSATNFVETIPIPASATGAGVVITQNPPQAYSTGISFCLTGGGSSTDNTNAATGVYVTIGYK